MASPLLAGEEPINPHKPSFSAEEALPEFTIGVYLLENGSVIRAVEHLEVAWQKSGHELAVGRRLAEGYFLLKNFTKCEMVTDDLLAQNAHDFETLLLKAKVRYIKRDPSGSVELLQSIREAHGTIFEVERMLGNLYYEIGDIENAVEAYGNCIRLNPSYPYIHYRYGLLLTMIHRYSDAEAAFLQAIEIDPGFSDPSLQLADIYSSSGRGEEAIPLLKNVLANDPGNSKALIKLAEVYLDTGLLDQGIKLLEARRTRSPLTREAEIVRGRIYYQAKDYDEAFVIFRDLFEQEKNSPELARILGEICLRNAEPDKAREYFDAAIEIDPTDYRSYLSKFFAASPDFTVDGSPILDLTAAEHAQLLTRASSLVKGLDFDGHYLLGVSYLSIDSLETALYHLLRAKEVRADDRGTLLNLANVYEKLGRLEDAEDCVITLHLQFPSDPDICNFYGYLLAEMGKELNKAESLIQEALEADPLNGYYLDSLGWVYYQMGDYAKAVIELEKASQRVPNDPIVLEHLGDAYRALRLFDEARAAYERSSLYQEGNSDIIEKIESTSKKSD
jgi:tetratricopeptide (TPR) repeat protein